MRWEAREPGAVCLPGGARVFPRESRKAVEGPWFRASFSQDFARYQGNALTVHEIETYAKEEEFRRAELHSDQELFFFTAGLSTMLLLEVDGERPRLETAVRVLLRPGDLLSLRPETAHYIGPSLTEKASCVVVAAREARTWYVEL